MSGPDHYVTAAMQTIVETRPVAAALEDWIRLAAAGPARDARTVEALAIVDRLGEFMAFEGMVADEAEDAPNVVGIFERRARAAGHPSMAGRDDCCDFDDPCVAHGGRVLPAHRRGLDGAS